jgi:hypothetical protein
MGREGGDYNPPRPHSRRIIMGLPLYLLTRKNQLGWDVAIAFVVAAADRHQARQFAAEKAGEEGKTEWTGIKFSTCQKIAQASIYHTPQVVVRDFRAS